MFKSIGRLALGKNPKKEYLFYQSVVAEWSNTQLLILLLRFQIHLPLGTSKNCREKSIKRLTLTGKLG